MLFNDVCAAPYCAAIITSLGHVALHHLRHAHAAVLGKRGIVVADVDIGPTSSMYRRK